VTIPEDVLEPLRRLHALGALEGRGELVGVACPFGADARVLAARRDLLGALLRHLAPMRLEVAQPEDDAAALEAVGVLRDGPSFRVEAGVDLDALDRAALHVGAWFLFRSPHASIEPLLGGLDPFRSEVLADVVRRGDAALVVASFYDDREWLIAGLV
jgi:hypothetical protein